MTSVNSQDYRELASKLREMAIRCRLPGARREILNIALRYERRADYFDERNNRQLRSSGTAHRKRAYVVHLGAGRLVTEVVGNGGRVAMTVSRVPP
jgi:hypothetical protein